MDENLALYAVQNKNESMFEKRYKIFSDKELRDEYWKMVTSGLNSETIKNHAKVELIVRVETEYD